MRSFCIGKPDRPSLVTVYRWLRSHPEFAVNYTRAREDQAETLAEEIIEISDEDNADAYIETRADGTQFAKIDGQAVQRSKLRVDSRKWVAAKLKPKKFGDKLDITSNNEHVNGKELTPAEREARAASIAAAAAARMKAKPVDPFS